MDKNEINKVFENALKHQEAGEFDKAKESYDKILDNEADLLAQNKGGLPDLSVNQMLSNVHNNYGIINFGNNDMREATRYFRNALDLIPESLG
jgi:Tfp pilus assembly protein PilF